MKDRTSEGSFSVTKRKLILLTVWKLYSVNSRGTKVEKMLTLAPERYTAEFCMVAKVILWCI